MIYIASDHGGFGLKNYIVGELEKKRVKVEDLGPFVLDPEDDYPDFAKKVSAKVADSPSKNLGVLICRNGQGMCIAANKFKGVRAITSWSEKHVASSRKDDNANVVCLPSDYITRGEALKVVLKFMNTSFSKLPRHQRRLKKVASFES
jgi:ribose 5-phosphate isomerase B